MNVDDLTIGEAKRLASMFQATAPATHNLTSAAIGKYVIVRTRNEGLNCGVLMAADETGCVLNDARRIWYSKPKDSKLSWYEGVAESGLASGSKISGKVEAKYIIEDYSITLCSAKGEKSLIEAKAHGS